MNRNKIEKLVSILKAHLDGKEIEFYSSTLNKWMTSSMNSIATLISNIDNYRIKPAPKYRPFKDAEECWKELLKHQPFGWVKDTEANEYLNVYCISNSASSIDLFGRMFKRCIFIDGSPYGIKVEE